MKVCPVSYEHVSGSFPLPTGISSESLKHDILFQLVKVSPKEQYTMYEYENEPSEVVYSQVVKDAFIDEPVILALIGDKLQ